MFSYLSLKKEIRDIFKKARLSKEWANKSEIYQLIINIHKQKNLKDTQNNIIKSRIQNLVSKLIKYQYNLI